MSRFVIADLHLGHKRAIQFRTQFSTIEEHDDYLVGKWNSVITDKDIVYVLGDVAMNRSAISSVARLRGRKKLIAGNHDGFRSKDFLPYFEDIWGAHQKSGIIMTHIPVHPLTVHRWRGNIHGHLHSAKIDDLRYRCVSCEHLDFTPISLEEVVGQFPEFTPPLPGGAS